MELWTRRKFFASSLVGGALAGAGRLLGNTPGLAEGTICAPKAGTLAGEAAAGLDGPRGIGGQRCRERQRVLAPGDEAHEPLRAKRDHLGAELLPGVRAPQAPGADPGVRLDAR